MIFGFCIIENNFPKLNKSPDLIRLTLTNPFLEKNLFLLKKIWKKKLKIVYNLYLYDLLHRIPVF